MKYKENFIRDVRWYVFVRHQLNFDGCAQYVNKKGESIIQYDKKGANGIESFFNFDSSGKIIKTKHPNILHVILKAKGSANLHIKMYAEDRAKGLMSKLELISLCKGLNAPSWFYVAIENQKMKLFKPC